MNRRTFLAGTGAVLLAAPLAAEAQSAGKVPRVGYLSVFSPSNPYPPSEAFWQGLHDLGWIEYTGADRARHSVRCFTCRLHSRAVSPNAAEIDEVAWFAWDRFPHETLHGTPMISAAARRSPAYSDN